MFMPTPITSRIDNPSMVAIERIFAILSQSTKVEMVSLFTLPDGFFLWADFMLSSFLDEDVAVAVSLSEVRPWSRLLIASELISFAIIYNLFIKLHL